MGITANKGDYLHQVMQIQQQQYHESTF